ncbi:sigma-70 family RNA polymerase sigma factor [bacterium]|nr:sigma-70 family RNA polymerase sigma factor [bacterium]
MNTSGSNEDLAIVEACKQGDGKAQKRLYDKHAPTMYAICLRYMSNEDEAKDALQEGFIKVFKNIGKFSHTGSFEGWLKRIFVNTSIEQIRKRKMHYDINEMDTNTPEFAKNLQMSSMDADKIMELVQQLPSGYRTVFNMYCVDGYSHKEIAEHLGVSENTSKSQLFKARKMLQNWLKHWFK